MLVCFEYTTLPLLQLLFAHWNSLLTTSFDFLLYFTIATLAGASPHLDVMLGIFDQEMKILIYCKLPIIIVALNYWNDINSFECILTARY